MRHNWIFDVLSDLQAYAERNGLPDLARNLGSVLADARWEVAQAVPPTDPVEEDGDDPAAVRLRRAH